MPSGFFSSGLIKPVVGTKHQLQTVPYCAKCGLLKGCQSPKMQIAGEGKREILIVGEAPGKNEDEQGKPFIGKAGKYLEYHLNKAGINLFEDCWVTNSLRCRPPSNAPPTDTQIDCCRPLLIKAIDELKPKVIIPLGNAAVKSLIGWLWREDTGGIMRWAGYQIPCQKLNAWVCPTFHPSFVMRDDDEQTKGAEVRELVWKKHLGAISEINDRPWVGPPNFSKRVHIVLNADDAAEQILQVFNGNGVIAFDYECEGLKPDSGLLEIVSCSLSNGFNTIAYPWHGKAIEATKTLLASPTPKIASNLKYEERWTLNRLGFPVNNWAWDTMLAAHILDNRADTTSIKFQAWVLLGQSPWDEKVTPFFKSDTANSKNRIREVPLTTLLIYNGMDSLMEWKVAMLQSEQLGVKL